MRKMRVFGFAAVVLLLCLAAREASACSCGEHTVRQKFRSADAVFVGKVLELTPTQPSKDFPLAVYVVKFEVERSWKGAQGRIVTALVDADIPVMCGDLKLGIGERYLIYAPRQKGQLRVLTDCGPNRDVKDAAEEMKRLDSPSFRTKARLFPYPKF